MDKPEIVVGVDGSPHADTAVRWAATRAQHTGARLRLLHAHAVPIPAPAMPLAAATPAAATIAVPDDYLAKAGEAILAAAADMAHHQAADIDVTTDLRVGGAAPVLIDTSADADLIVVGSRGLGGFTGLLLGSTSQAVLHHATCPVAVTRPGQAVSQQQ